MIRKLVVASLVVVMCLAGITSALAQGMPSPSQYTTVNEYEKVTNKKIVKFNEAPMLRTMVAAGKLPSIKERLPEEPLVLMTVEEIGQYGGTWRRAWLGTKYYDLKRGKEPIIRLNPNAISEVLPNVAKDWKISDGGKVYTFYLRKGLKWSDGVPFTADDMLFFYEDVVLNKELSPVTSKMFRSVEEGGFGGKFEKIDDYTVRFTFPKAYGLFLIQLTAWEFSAPKHYMKKFHPRYTSMEELEKMINEAGFEFWYQLYHSKGGDFWWDINPDHPTLWPWKLTVPSPATRMVQERNPYYWKVDPEGNQLPYIDRVIWDVVADTDMLNLKATMGELDFRGWWISTENYTLFMKNREKEDYRVLRWRDIYGANPMIMLNQTCENLALRKIFQDVRFRQALSLAINREEINELCFSGMGVPRQASLVKGASYYSEEWEKNYAEYDPKRASVLLDEMGLKWDEKHRYRLRPDDEVLSLTIEFAPIFENFPNILELVKEYWESVGVRVATKSENRSFYTTRREANKLQVGVWTQPGFSMLRNNWWAFPCDDPDIEYASLYARWYLSDGETGEKPTRDFARLQKIWDEIQITVDKQERDNLVKEAVRLHIKNVWLIGTVGDLPKVVIVKNRFRNVPDTLIFANVLSTPFNANQSQFFIRQK